MLVEAIVQIISNLMDNPPGGEGERAPESLTSTFINMTIIPLLLNYDWYLLLYITITDY